MLVITTIIGLFIVGQLGYIDSKSQGKKQTFTKNYSVSDPVLRFTTTQEGTDRMPNASQTVIPTTTKTTSTISLDINSNIHAFIKKTI